MTIEDVESFRLRARAWLAENMPRAEDAIDPSELDGDGEIWTRGRELQKLLFSGGFAGLCFPTEYGGQGLTPAHQEAFNQEVEGYEIPVKLNTPSLSICAPVIMDFGTEEQKQKYVRGAISGEIILCQLLSEPRGGSDLAGVITRVDKDGDTWVLNGQKIWSTSANHADYGLCLTRTDFDAPKHRGLSMFVVPIHTEGVTLREIRMVAGESDFCEEFFDDVQLPSDALIGQENDGWTVASRQLVYERMVGGGSPYVTGRHLAPIDKDARTPAGLAKDLGCADDPMIQDWIGRAHVQKKISHQVTARVGRAIAAGILPGPAGSISRLMHAETAWTERDAMVEIAGAYGVSSAGDLAGPLGKATDNYVMRQSGSLGGGSTEMARNIISERVLGMPRDAGDKDIPFNQIRQGR